MTMENLFGEMVPPPDLKLEQKVEWLLREHPRCRDEDGELVVRFWWEFEGLSAVLDEGSRDRLAAFMERATSPDTITRRRRELQRLESGGSDGDLAPSKTVAKRRRKQYRAGPPR